jgi:argininosuccinate lyase
VHLSRLSEDVILWATAEFGFIELSDAHTTGSSLMPQKKNPDVAELTRGKTGRLLGNLVALLTTIKGLPMTYNRDLQEDKEPLFDSIDQIKLALEVFAEMMAAAKVREDRTLRAASDPFLLATEASPIIWCYAACPSARRTRSPPAPIPARQGPHSFLGVEPGMCIFGTT